MAMIDGGSERCASRSVGMRHWGAIRFISNCNIVPIRIVGGCKVAGLGVACGLWLWVLGFAVQ